MAFHAVGELGGRLSLGPGSKAEMPRLTTSQPNVENLWGIGANRVRDRDV